MCDSMLLLCHQTARHRPHGVRNIDSRNHQSACYADITQQRIQPTLKSITWVELFNTIGFVITYYYYGVYSAIAWYLLVMCILVVTFKKETKKIIKFIKEIK